MSRIIRTLFVIILVAVVGCSQQTEKTEAPDNTDESKSGVSVTLGQVPEPVKLTERSVERFISAAKELSQLGKNVDLDASKGAGFMQGVTLSADALEILNGHDFEPTEFQRVAYSIGLAMAAADMTAEDRASMKKSQEKLESMKGTLPAAQYEAMKQQMTGAMNILNHQPEGNVELVAKYRKQIEGIGNP